MRQHAPAFERGIDDARAEVMRGKPADGSTADD